MNPGPNTSVRSYVYLYLMSLIKYAWICFSLSDYINAKLEEKGCDIIDGLEEFVPEDIEVQHAVEVWKVACQKSEDYHSRLQ